MKDYKPWFKDISITLAIAAASSIIIFSLAMLPMWVMLVLFLMISFGFTVWLVHLDPEPSKKD